MTDHVSTGTSDIISATVIDRLIKSRLYADAVLLPTITDLSNLAVVGSNKVQILRPSQLTTAALVEDTLATAQHLVLSAEDLLLDKNYASVVRVSDIVYDQSAGNVEPIIASELSKVFMNQVEAHIYAELAKASDNTPDHRIAFTSSFSEDDILSAKYLLDVANVPLSERYIAINPQEFKLMLGTSGFVNAANYGTAFTQAAINGLIGQVYGFQVVMSNNVTAGRVVAYHKSAVNFALQRGLTYRVDRAPAEYFANNYSMSILYGVAVTDKSAAGSYGGKRQVLLGSAS